MTERLTHDLLTLLGTEAFVGLTDNFAGTRLYVPLTVTEEHDIARAIGVAAARRLSSRYAPAVIRVPLAREVRARHYLANGESNARIATRLGMTETGVDKMVARMTRPPRRKATDQLSFDLDRRRNKA